MYIWVEILAFEMITVLGRMLATNENILKVVINHFLFQLTQEASGDEMEFYTMFSDVQALLQQLKSHNYDNLKTSEESELSKANRC